jgi:chromosomal replication initiator protein
MSAPENRSALAAVQRVAACVGQRRPRGIINPLFLHGPTGTGKTHLVSALIHDLLRRAPELTVAALAASDFALLAHLANSDAGDQAATDILPASRHADILVVEDVQHLRPGADEALVGVFDYRLARAAQMVFTATVGPRRLEQLSARLASRLGSGLVGCLEPLQAASRLALLQDKARLRQLVIRGDILAWLAEHLTGGGRQLDGALNQLETLAQLHPRLDLAVIVDAFRAQAEVARPTIDRIAQRVGSYFRLQPRQLQSRRQLRQVLLPRQVGMYLARQLTHLSLKQIGTYFGGRDHSTVLHACRKVEQALGCDVTFSGAVRQMHAELV